MPENGYLWCHSVETRPEPSEPCSRGECYRCGCAIWITDRDAEMVELLNAKSSLMVLQTTCMPCSGVLASLDTRGGFLAEPNALRRFLGLESE